MTETRLISLLADGQFHSGEALGEALGVSRAAVWKQLQKLETRGVPVESIKGRGYRVPGGLELLGRDQIYARLPANIAEQLPTLEILQQVTSTNSYLLDRVGEHAFHGRVCLAEQQTGGRGRRGRTWVSPFGRNLYLSLGWTFDGGVGAIEGLSLAVGVAVARALSPLLGPRQVGLKWPNDILWGERKLGGVLVEMQGDVSDRCQVVVGIGLNAGMSQSVDHAIDQPWADLRETGAPFSRNALAAAVICELVAMLSRFSEQGFAPFRAEWEQYDAYRGQPVTLLLPNETVRGTALGVAANGALRLDVDGSEAHYYGGEVSLRGGS